MPHVGKFYLDDEDDHIKDVLRKGIPWEGQVRELIDLHAWPGTVAIDIGAHIGAHTLSMAKRAEKVYAFEPQPKLFRELVANVALNEIKNVEPYCCAVGDTFGEIELSPLTAGNEGATPLRGGSGTLVPLLPLDALCLKNVSLIKIDVEGMEDRVLVGAKKTLLENHPVVVIEIMGGYMPETAPPAVQEKIYQTIQILKDLHFRIYRISIHDYLAL